MRLENKVAVVTGAAGGIGRAIIEKLVSEGARVIAVDISEAALQEVIAEHPQVVSPCIADVTNYQQVTAAIEQAVAVFGGFDVMINNAGIGLPKPLLDYDADDFDVVTEINQKGVFHGILAAGRKFRSQARGGAIINTSSVYGATASEMTFSYNTSKAAVDMMTKCAALELAPLGVRVCAVAPGRVDTPLLRQYEALGLWDHIRREQMRETFTQPLEIAAVVAFLASDDANCVNGTTVYADDGFSSFKYPLLPSQDS